ncbi:hypothetical protein G5C65_38260, partial [Streptomyces sp. SB3404]|nr:hypothetical protein [Streptomyces boncukensis]
FARTSDGRVVLSGLGGFEGPAGAALPLVEVALAGEGSTGTAGKRHVDGALGRRLRYERHTAAARRHTVHRSDPETGLRVAAHYETGGAGQPDGSAVPTLRTWAELRADAGRAVMGDPTTERLLPLVDAAAGMGAEVFCVDAGWYDEDRRGPGP